MKCIKVDKSLHPSQVYPKTLLKVREETAMTLAESLVYFETTDEVAEITRWLIDGYSMDTGHLDYRVHADHLPYICTSSTLTHFRVHSSMPTSCNL